MDLLHREVDGGRLLLRGGGAPKRQSEDGQDGQGSQKLFHSRPLLSYLVWTKYIMSHCHSLVKAIT